MACDKDVNSAWGSPLDFETRYTGEDIKCGDEVLIEQGESLRSVVETLGNKACEADSNNDAIVAKVNELETSLEETDTTANNALTAANNADAKAQEALDEIANLPTPVTEVDPADLGLSLSGRVPVSQNSDNWMTNGISYSNTANPNTLGYRYTDGRMRVGTAVEPTDAVTLQQLEDAVLAEGVQPDNIGLSPIVNSPRSLILKSRNSSIELLNNSNNQSNIILGSDAAMMKGQIFFNTIVGSAESEINQGTRQAIISSHNCELRGVPGHPGIVFGTSSERVIIASSESSINGFRRNTAIIASHRVTMENYVVTGQTKWNIAAVAARECHVKSSNSYVIVTGQGNVTNASSQVVMGCFNLDLPSVSMYNPDRKALVVGNGEAGSYLPDGTPQDVNRSNAFEVLHKGKAWVQNEFEIGKPGGGVVLSSPNGSKFLLTVRDDGSIITTAV